MSIPTKEEEYAWNLINTHAKYVKQLEERNMHLEGENSHLSDLVGENKKLKANLLNALCYLCDSLYRETINQCKDIGKDAVEAAKLSDLKFDEAYEEVFFYERGDSDRECYSEIKRRLEKDKKI